MVLPERERLSSAGDRGAAATGSSPGMGGAGARSAGSPSLPGSAGAPRGLLQRRRDRIAAEIERNRRGEYKVPTWVLAVILLAVLAGWAAVIIFS